MASKKLIVINSTILMLVFGAFIAATALINYPWFMRFRNYIEWSDILYLLATLAFLALVSWMISTLNIGNLTPTDRFLLIYSVLCGFLFSYFMYVSTDAYLTAQKAILQTENRYFRQAREDIRNGRITFRYAGGLAIPDEWDGEIACIRRKYGIRYQNTGCTVDPVEMKGQEKYKEIVQPYLDERNGKGWEKRMKEEIEKIKN